MFGLSYIKTTADDAASYGHDLLIDFSDFGKVG
jgi:hypothetical protein